MRNPFYYGGSVAKEHFCNRVEELKELTIDIKSGLNLLIYAPRRFGKTSLVLRAVEDMKSDGYKCVFIDLMHITTIDEFISTYFDKLASSLEEPTDKVVKFFKSVLKIRPNISVNFDASGTPSFSLLLNNKERDMALEDVLNIPFEFAKNGQKIVVVFDEFQEIANLDLEAKLRSVIQHHSNQLSYIFMGSKKSLLNAMFRDKSRPFYKSVKHFTIGEIDEASWVEFISEKFAKTEKSIDERFIKKAVDLTGGFAYYTQQIAYELWSKTEKEVDEECYEKAIATILDRESDLFANEWDNLTPNQKKTLKVLISRGDKTLYDDELLAKHKIKSSSMQTALKALVEKDIVDKTADGYYMVDPIFRFWLESF